MEFLLQAHTQKLLNLLLDTSPFGLINQHYDNAAINILMKRLGGPKAITAFSRSTGDNAFRLDRWEPDLNSIAPGSVLDTTTPEEMGKSIQKLVLGSVLDAPQRELLQTWLKNNTDNRFF